LALADEAKAMARRMGDLATLLKVFERCASATEFPSEFGTHLVEAAEQVAAADSLDDPFSRCNAAIFCAHCAFRAGRFELADEQLAIGRALAARLQQPGLVWMATFRSASRALSLGDVTQGEEVAAAALDVGTSSGQPDAFGFYAMQVMMTRLMQGRFGEVVSLVADAAEQYPAIPAFTAALASSRLDGGDEAGAKELIDRAGAASFSFPQDSGWLDAIVNYARVAIELGLADHAGALFERLAPFHDQVPTTGVVPYEPIAMYLGALAAVLGRYDEAETYFAEAEDLNTRGAMRFAEANTTMLWGRMLRQRGGTDDRERARELLREARNAASLHGYAAVERRATAELSKLG
jgi:tetratricopeptide (TPR) repeat protein